MPVLAEQQAAEADDEQVLALEALEVTALRLQRELSRTPAAVSVLEQRELVQGRPNLALDESLTRVPGLFLQNRYNFAQGQRLSIRGFGARAPFGVRGVRVVLDGIPQTTPDGQSQLDAVDLSSVQRIEVVRGLSSSLYGNASGGLIQIESQRGEGPPELALSSTLGSDGLARTGFQYGVGDQRWNAHVSGWHLDFDGYSQQARVHSRLLRARLGHVRDDGSELTLLLGHVNAPRRSDMGGLTSAELARNRRAANPLAVALDANQAVTQQQLALAWSKPLQDGSEWQLRGFHVQRDFRGQLPFPGASIVAFDRDFSGLGLQYSGSSDVAGRALRYTLGADAEQQRDLRERFLRFANGGFGALSLQQQERAGFVAVHGQGELALGERLSVTSGLRLDRLRFRIDDRFQAAGIDLSGQRSYQELSAHAGLSLALGSAQQAYITVGNAFESPSFTEFANPSGAGGFNPQLGAQQSRGVDLGLRGEVRRLRYEASLFRTDVNDELVPFQRDDPMDARTYYRNAGRTQRQGLELAANADLAAGLVLSLAWTRSSFRYLRFEDVAGNRFDGKRLPGLPGNTLFTELAWRAPSGPFVIVDAMHVGGLYADDANQVRVPAHTVWNVRAGTELRGRRLQGDLFLAFTNLGNTRYNANVRINAANGRYFEPAPDRSAYLGFTLHLGRR